jgi:hypothetical protein
VVKTQNVRGVTGGSGHLTLLLSPREGKSDAK